CLQGDSPPHSF
nr:immunoglobulin light chain junction region [Macaca mulatta]